MSEEDKRHFKYLGHAVRLSKHVSFLLCTWEKVEEKRIRGEPSKNLADNFIEASQNTRLHDMERNPW